MKVEQITSFGKGFHYFLPEIKKMKQRTIVPFIKGMLKELGLILTFKVLWKTSRETKKMKKHHWTGFEKKHHFSKENIFILIEDLSMMKVLKETVGEKKAKRVLSNILCGANKYLKEKTGQNLLLIPDNEIKMLQDRFSGFKDFIITLEKALEKDNFHHVKIIEDSNNSFGFDIKFCIMHEIAKELGDINLCFFSCQLDDVVFPPMGAEIGFQYSRSETLVKGDPFCRFRFRRVH